MIELVETLSAWRTDGVAFGRAVVVRVFGSSPRPAGSTLLAAADGRIAGSISGGCVDGAAVEEIRRASTDGRSRVIRYGISDEQARGIGLACGGTIDVLIEPLVSDVVEQAARSAAGSTDAGEARQAPAVQSGIGSAVGPAIGSANAPSGLTAVGPATGSAVGPAIGSARAPSDLTAVGPATGSTAGHAIGSARAPSGGTAVGPATGSAVGPAIGSAKAPSGGTAVGPVVGSAVVTPLPADAPGAAIGPVPAGDGEPPAAPLLIRQDGRIEGTLGRAELDAQLVAQARGWLDRGLSRIVELEDRQFFVEVFPARPRLLIVGAGQIAVPLVDLARTLGYETIVADGRQAFATRERFPTADRVIVGWPDEVAAEIGLGPSDSVAVLSHDPKFDEPAIAIALALGCRYVGAIGSRRTQAERHERLVAQGLRPEDIARLRGPIGLDLGGSSPAETALAILAEIVALRRGGTGVSLRDKARAKAVG